MKQNGSLLYTQYKFDRLYLAGFYLNWLIKSYCLLSYDKFFSDIRANG